MASSQHRSVRPEKRGIDTRSEEEIRDELIMAKQQHRVAHPMLLPLPLAHTSVVNPNQYMDNYEEVKHELYAILEANNIDVRILDLVHRTLPGEQATQAHAVTLLIQARGFNQIHWEEAVIHLAKAVMRLRAPSYTRSILVEIIDYRALDPFSFPIATADQDLINAWEVWMAEAVLSYMAGTHWQTLSLEHRGIVSVRSECPRTICITAWDAASSAWSDVKRNLRLELNLDLDVEVRQAQPWHGAVSEAEQVTERMDPSFWGNMVKIGQSVGPRTVAPGQPGSGSIGGQIVLEGKAGEQLSLAMTCYHVALHQASGSAESKPLSSLLLDKTTTDFLVNSPSDRDHEDKAAAYKMQIEDLDEWLYGGEPSREELISYGKRIAAFDSQRDEHQRLKAGLSKIEKANRALGHVIAHSGYQAVVQGSRKVALDWALTTIPPPREVVNAFPARGEAPSIFQPIEWFLQDIPGWSVKSLAADTTVMKYGRSTGWTLGMMATTSSWIHLEQEKPWKQDYHCVVNAIKIHNHKEAKAGHGQRTFATGGDSGAWVFDTKTGAWVGMIFGGPGGEDFAYMTPSDVLVQNIEAVTTFKVVEPRKVE